MQTHFTTLAGEILRLPQGIICLTGGGGKSTLMYCLGKALSQLGNSGIGARVLLTTTTRLMRPTPEQSRFFLECPEPESLALPDIPCVMTAARPAGPGQNPDYLRGYSGDEVNTLWQRGVADWIIVEADGSARRPLKAPADKEPVIPSLTGLTIAVAGLSAVGGTYDDASVFRPKQFTAITGLEPGNRLVPEALAALFTDPAGLFKGTPENARRIAFFNQADATGGMEAALPLGRALLQKHADMFYGIYAGSARQPEAPCLRLVNVHPLHEVFAAQMMLHLHDIGIKSQFLPEGLWPHAGHLTRVELEGKQLYACLDFYEKGQVDVNVMEKLGQGPLLSVLIDDGNAEKLNKTLTRFWSIFRDWEFQA